MDVITDSRRHLQGNEVGGFGSNICPAVANPPTGHSRMIIQACARAVFGVDTSDCKRRIHGSLAPLLLLQSHAVFVTLISYDWAKHHTGNFNVARISFECLGIAS